MIKTRVCCNCRHCTRQWDDKKQCHTYCDIDNRYIGYVECHTGWCRHWSKERWEDE